MNIFFYAPFKPLTHPNPSGDLVIGRGLYRFLENRGHRLWTPSRLRCRWVYWKPARWPGVWLERRRACRRAEKVSPDIWLTYHTYYKAPDVIGPWAAKKANIPYVVFQGIYSTKRRRDIRTGPGFILNRRALKSACHVFTNRKEDEKNLRRIIPDDRLTYAPPGIYPDDFRFDPEAREELRRSWNVGDSPVVLSAAMFRPDVKTEGLLQVIQACGELHGRGFRFHLAVAGDGKEKGRLMEKADRCFPGRVVFAGKIPRERMHRFYSAGDLFVFPGIRESLGMVFLESQACGLPVVAFRNGGIPEVVRENVTGFLTPFMRRGPFADAMARLLTDPGLAKRMGQAAARHVREHHDLEVNYRRVENRLVEIAESRRP